MIKNQFVLALTSVLSPRGEDARVPSQPVYWSALDESSRGMARAETYMQDNFEFVGGRSCAKWNLREHMLMDAIIKMDRFGRLVLPGAIRRALQISQPAAFKAEVMGNKVELTLVTPEGGAVLKKRRGLLVVSTGGRKFNAAEAVRIARGERS